MSDLVEFLTARLDEDDEAALDMLARDWTLTGRDVMAAGFVIAEASSDLTARHIAHYDPARSRREIEAKRQHLARYQGALLRQQAEPGDERNNGYVVAMSQVLQDDTAVYSGHPDYDEAWRPE